MGRSPWSRVDRSRGRPNRAPVTTHRFVVCDVQQDDTKDEHSKQLGQWRTQTDPFLVLGPCPTVRRLPGKKPKAGMVLMLASNEKNTDRQEVRDLGLVASTYVPTRLRHQSHQSQRVWGFFSPKVDTP